MEATGDLRIVIKAAYKRWILGKQKRKRLSARIFGSFQDHNISYNELKSLIEKSKDLLIVDVRSQDEVDKGCIPGSIHIPVNDVEREFSLDAKDFQEKFGVPKPPLDSRELVFHCQLGRRGGVATEKARSLGFSGSKNYAGGYKEWSEKEGN